MQRHASRSHRVAIASTFIDAHVQRNSNHGRRLIVRSARFLGTKPRFALDENGGLVLPERAERYEETIQIRLWDGLRLARHRLGPAPGPELTRALVREMAAVAQANATRLVVLTWNQRDSWGNEALMNWEKPETARQTDLSSVDPLTDRPSAWDDGMIESDEHPDARARAHVAAVPKTEFARLGLLRKD